DDDAAQAGGDIMGIIEADSLALEELPPLAEGLDFPSDEEYEGSAWRLSALTVLAPRPPIIEDEDGDLCMPRAPLAPPAAKVSLAPPAAADGTGGITNGAKSEATIEGWRIELCR
ncbi:unnamed protein product, partial [Polarella glacialis]